MSNCLIGWRNKPIQGLSRMSGRLTQRSGRGLATAMKTMQRLFLKFDPGGAFLACGQLVGRAGMGGPGRITIGCQTVHIGCRPDLCWGSRGLAFERAHCILCGNQSAPPQIPFLVNRTNIARLNPFRAGLHCRFIRFTVFQLSLLPRACGLEAFFAL